MAALTKQVEVVTAAQARAASRSETYQLLASSFRFPAPDNFESIKAGNIRDRLQQIVPHLPYSFSTEQMPAGTVDLKFEEFQSLYIGLFEVGKSGTAPCPLYEGCYGGVRSAIMAELLAFYHFFGVRPSQQEPRELPDHLSLELEFMHVLTFKEAEASVEGKKLEAYLKAERDFLKRHLAGFAAAVRSRSGQSKAPFFSDMIALTERFCSSDLAYLSGQIHG